MFLFFINFFSFEHPELRSFAPNLTLATPCKKPMPRTAMIVIRAVAILLGHAELDTRSCRTYFYYTVIIYYILLFIIYHEFSKSSVQNSCIDDYISADHNIYWTFLNVHSKSVKIFRQVTIFLVDSQGLQIDIRFYDCIFCLVNICI